MFNIVILTLFIRLSSSEEITVDTPSGKYLGSTLQSRFGKTIYAFRSIRYAKPPIDDLRFKPPVPVAKKTLLYNATLDRAVCPQVLPAGIKLEMSEDCLFLNVYTPKVKSGNRPVIIFLHGGGLLAGTGNLPFAGPQYLLDQDVVLVTLNYRLGALGFITLGRDSPGNNGFRDQIVAFKWVKDNIRAFGGNPDSVTLYGYSAGSCSISFHLVSPLAKNLFHKAILSSCSLLGPLPKPEDQLIVAEKQARFVGCPNATPRIIYECLKTKSAEEIANSIVKFQEFEIDPLLIYTAVVEDNYGQERFLVEEPYISVEKNNFNRVPILAGITKDEFANKAFVFGNDDLLKNLSTRWERWAPICFGYDRLELNTLRSREISRAIRSFYFGGNQAFTKASIPIIGEIYNDALTGYPTNRLVSLFAQKLTAKPVYYYEFTYSTRSNGEVYHGEDNAYLLYFSALYNNVNTTQLSQELITKLTIMWANFAKNNNPIGSSKKQLDDVDWIPYEEKSKTYLDIGSKLVLKEDLRDKRYSFWSRVYRLEEGEAISLT